MMLRVEREELKKRVEELEKGEKYSSLLSKEECEE